MVLPPSTMEPALRSFTSALPVAMASKPGWAKKRWSSTATTDCRYRLGSWSMGVKPSRDSMDAAISSRLFAASAS